MQIDNLQHGVNCASDVGAGATAAPGFVGDVLFLFLILLISGEAGGGRGDGQAASCVELAPLLLPAFARGGCVGGGDLHFAVGDGCARRGGLFGIERLPELIRPLHELFDAGGGRLAAPFVAVEADDEVIARPGRGDVDQPHALLFRTRLFEICQLLVAGRFEGGFHFDPAAPAIEKHGIGIGASCGVQPGKEDDGEIPTPWRRGLSSR